MKEYFKKKKRPLNYLEDNEVINKKFLEDIISNLASEKNISDISKKIKKRSSKYQNRQKFEDVVKEFKEFYYNEKNEEKIERNKYKNNREILTEVFYDVLYEALLNIKKLKPSDPFDYLVF